MVAGGCVSGWWQAIQCVASSGLAAPHSSQKNSNDDCCIDFRVFFHHIFIPFLSGPVAAGFPATTCSGPDGETLAGPAGVAETGDVPGFPMSGL